ncbi:uncharacterized protein MYCFIDRAFT_87989 [Pseudocercospora fijiensis CIRAD86]|uniref:Secreted protein n=1 Tax=Pseudocercospora fijiensis (strain CIRAD86) TaxID=383855 RepID=M3A9E9_PSEFD|nr:uncharacterized protein MYCFIDRAFT_87989 [Pseudocercospora fijiensis CIRAD86]EME81246.1 hypothetical protein MYCFIDRAFT_87989 [Pseudocercospora fijiensis CIRAD86]
MKSILIFAITAILSLASALEGINGFTIKAMDHVVAPRFNKFRIRGVNQYDEKTAPSPWGQPPKSPSGGPPNSPKSPWGGEPPKSPGSPPKSGSPGSPKGTPGSPKSGGGCDLSNSSCDAGYTLNCKNGQPNCHLTNPSAACGKGGVTWEAPNGQECCAHCTGTGCPEAEHKLAKSKSPCQN